MTRINHVQLGDAVIAVDEQPVRSDSDLMDILEQLEAGATVPVVRAGQQLKANVTLAVSR